VRCPFQGISEITASVMANMVNAFPPVIAVRYIIDLAIASHISSTATSVVFLKLLRSKHFHLFLRHSYLTESYIKQHHSCKTNHTTHSSKMRITAALRFRD
jgi:hypothetical protein